MKPYYYRDEWVKQYYSDALKVLSGLEGDSVDLLATDPPYGISFMGKDWDKALPDIDIWRECLRVLKAGSFAFVMSIPRADCLSRMIISLEDAGFLVNFTPIFWAYASGFPKAQNIGKAVDKRLGVEREVVGARHRNVKPYDDSAGWNQNETQGDYKYTEAQSPQAKALDGSYGGFQPKPAVEVIIVAMKPLSEKTFIDQALNNQKGITWLDDCRIPFINEADKGCFREAKGQSHGLECFTDKPKSDISQPDNHGRFPANLLVSDDVLNDGRVRKVGNLSPGMGKGYHVDEGTSFGTGCNPLKEYGGDSGSFSRYFDLDKWWAKTFPFLIVPKASKSEKNKGLDGKSKPPVLGFRPTLESNPENWATLIQDMPYGGTNRAGNQVNNHPTVKPLKLMSYLITLGSRQGDAVLDPFSGSGTTLLASKSLNRKCIGIEINEKYCEIAANRCRQMVFDFNK